MKFRGLLALPITGLIFYGASAKIQADYGTSAPTNAPISQAVIPQTNASTGGLSGLPKLPSLSSIEAQFKNVLGQIEQAQKEDPNQSNIAQEQQIDNTIASVQQSIVNQQAQQANQLANMSK